MGTPLKDVPELQDSSAKEVTSKMKAIEDGAVQEASVKLGIEFAPTTVAAQADEAVPAVKDIPSTPAQTSRMKASTDVTPTDSVRPLPLGIRLSAPKLVASKRTLAIENAR